MDRTTKQFIQGISKKPGTSSFETIGLTDFNNIDEEVKVLNVYPVPTAVYNTPNVQVTYLDGTSEVIPKTALLKVWMVGRNSKRRWKYN